ncbi:MAG: two-component system sensor histidine kinase CreC [Burkholderiaceae bacterium]|nr:two-component system sensor histidine kinase CreC [Burkholderiaceae bacterium]
MSKRNRIFLGILAAYLIGVAALLYNQLAEIDPRYRESAEDSLVETSQLLSTIIEQNIRDGIVRPEVLRPVFQSLYAKNFSAKIFSVEKNQIELRVYVTDKAGRVLFDSTGKDEGADYSQWRDVARTLNGQYGARSTADIKNDDRTTVMYVGAPIRLNNEIIGVVSVAKPVQSFGQYVQAAREKTVLVGVYSVAAVIVLVLILSVWLVRPFGLVTDYVRYVRAQRNFSLPRLSRRALRAIGAAYDEMRDALAGRNYVADYVQTLTHELKSPLSAIRGAAELLQEPMPKADRQRFLGNITRETQRVQELVDHMLELAALETRRHLDSAAPIFLGPLLEEIAASAATIGAKRQVKVQLEIQQNAWIEGDIFLIRRAVTNLIDNAIDFSPAGATVSIILYILHKTVQIQVHDKGPGIPEYAEEKVFEKFFSLARPHNKKKSTGLGLAFVKEIAELHRGRISLKNASEGGALAILSLPLLPTPTVAAH